MQRIKVGLTGLGAVLLIVAVSAAIFETASNKPAPPPPNASEQTVANMMTNTAGAPSEPLAEIGVTPSGPTVPADNTVTPVAK